MSDLLIETRDHVVRVTINRPGQRKAMSEAVIDGIAALIREAGGKPDVRAIVISGSGDKAFCAGADLGTGKAFEFDYSQPSLAFANLLRAAHQATVPLVARVNGACVAGGMGLLSMCDLAVAVDSAKFGLPEVKVGVFPMQVLSVMQRLVPSRVLHELCLTGELIPAADALRIGLVNYVVPAAELDSKLDWLLARVLDKAPSAIRRGRYAMRAVESMTFDQSISFTESQIGLLSMTEDAREGLLAFREKRKPTWTGR